MAQVKSDIIILRICLKESAIVDESLVIRFINSPLDFSSKALAGNNPTFS